MNSAARLIAAVLLAAALPGSLPANAKAASEAAVAAMEPAYKAYRYSGDGYRDPFIPLIGQGSGGPLHEQAPQIQSLVLKGIVQDAKGRMALLTSGVSSYILRGGRLYDPRNRQVKKISGVIKAESVVLIGSDRTVREIRINKPVL